MAYAANRINNNADVSVGHSFFLSFVADFLITIKIRKTIFILRFKILFNTKLRFIFSHMHTNSLAHNEYETVGKLYLQMWSVSFTVRSINTTHSQYTNWRTEKHTFRTHRMVVRTLKMRTQMNIGLCTIKHSINSVTKFAYSNFPCNDSSHNRRKFAQNFSSIYSNNFLLLFSTQTRVTIHKPSANACTSIMNKIKQKWTFLAGWFPRSINYEK